MSSELFNCESGLIKLTFGNLHYRLLKHGRGQKQARENKIRKVFMMPTSNVKVVLKTFVLLKNIITVLYDSELFITFLSQNNRIEIEFKRFKV